MTLWEKVKESWLAARKIYQQTEVFRFGNPVVDDWEGKVNAWPLDEGLIDYVDNTKYYPSENDFSNFNVIANKKLKVEGTLVDASIIDFNLLHEARSLNWQRRQKWLLCTKIYYECKITYSDNCEKKVENCLTWSFLLAFQSWKSYVCNM